MQDLKTYAFINPNLPSAVMYMLCDPHIITVLTI